MTRMILYRFLLFLVVFSGLSKSYGQDSERVLFKINDHEISSEEFIYTYEKNNLNPDSLSQQEAVLEYLDLFINFKLKVQEAFDLGLDTTKAFTSEFNMYRDQLAEPYLKEKKVTDSLLHQAYSRLKWEVNASHILIRAQGDDTVRAYEKIMTAYNRATKGESFEELALEYSEDPSVRQNQGNLGYFTALQMVYPFENAAYDTNAGEVSYPFRTRFGYHILKIHDRTPSKGEVEVAHIMLLVPQEASDNERRATHLKIIEIRDMLLNGADWDQVVMNYTEDQNTRNSGGVLPPFSYGRMIPSFAEASFALEDPEDISEPVRTPYGWHVIKLIRKMPLDEFDVMKPDLEQKITRDSRSELSSQALLNRLEEENNFIEHTYSRNQLITGIKQKLDSDSANIESGILYSDSIIFSIQKENHYGKDIISFVKKRNPSGVKQSIPKIRNWYEEYRESKLLAYEKEHLEEKFYDFNMLINEYREGILLFDRMEDKVWNKATEDSTGLKLFFDKVRNNYKWEERVYTHIYQSSSIDIIDSVKQIMQNILYEVENGVYVLSDPDPGHVAGILDSLIISFRRDTTMLIRIVGDMEVINDIKKPVSDSIQNQEWFQHYCIWKESDDKGLHIQLFTSSKKYLETIFNRNSTLNLRVRSDFFEKGDEDILDLVEWEPGIYDLSIEDQEYVVEIVKRVPPRLKYLDETRGKVISDYQEYLESEWIKELKKTYKVKVIKKEFKRIIREIEQG